MVLLTNPYVALVQLKEAVRNTRSLNVRVNVVPIVANDHDVLNAEAIDLS
jgi:hypothetical protein